MIISRAEFHQREGLREFDIIEERDELMSIERLYKEIVADVPFRNHNFMFDESQDWRDLELQEEDGIKKAFPEIITERERYEKIKEEILKDTYESVPVLKDADYPDVIYVDNGFHRIFIANELGLKVIRVKAKYGKFILHKSITFNDLISLLDMLSQLFKEKDSVIELNNFLKMIVTKKPEMGETYSITYGRDGKK
jgi:hypothetical protein